MTEPAPKTRETLACIREAARSGMTIEQFAPTIGLTPNRLATWCRDAQIPMVSDPMTAPGARPGAQRIEKPPADAAKVFGLAFDREGRAWRGDKFIELDHDTHLVLEMIARAAPRVASRNKIEHVIAGSHPASRRRAAYEMRVATLLRELPRLRCSLAIADGGAHIALVKHSLEAEAAEDAA